MRRNITDRTIDALKDSLSGTVPEVSAMLYDVPFDPPKLSEEDKAFWETLSEEDKQDFVEVEGKKYSRKIYERNKQNGL